MLVVDASAALYAATSMQGLDQLVPWEPVAPPLLWSEALSVLHESAWRKAISHDLAARARDRLLSAAIERRAPEELHIEAWRTAEELGWAKTYDAEYVALARLLGCSLLTVDGRLRRGAGRLVAIMGPTEL